MPLNFNADSAAARDFAKRCIQPGEKLEMGLLISALFHTTHLKESVSELSPFLEEPEECCEEVPSEVSLADDLIPTLTNLAKEDTGPIIPEELFVRLLWSPAGMLFAAKQGVTEEALNTALSKLKSVTREEADSTSLDTSEPPRKIGWRATSQREKVLKELNAFGRMLTEGTPPREKLIGMEESLQAVLRSLVKRKQRSALITGAPGTGKTALVRELARRLMEGHPSIPTYLRDFDIFELSPTFLRAGTTLLGQYEERVSTLIKTLTKNSKVILFVDEVHSMLQSGIHERSNFTDANEAFKQALARGDFSLIGVTTTAEYRYYLEPDQALIQRFSIIRIEPPTPQETLTIVKGRLPEIEGFYNVEIPEEIVREIVELTEEYLPGRAQPRKSIHFLDEACAYCITRIPPIDIVTEDALWEVLEDTIGHSIAREGSLTQEGLFKELAAKIVGQDEVLKGISQAFISGMGGWVADREAPRGVFFFGGPTGVGKTETALLLSEIMGGGRESLVRVDCNTLQSSGGDSGQAINILLGPPPGYIGYVRGKGGLLSRVREHPESIVLFDEIEKADPAVGEILLQIMDSGRCEDSDGNLLNFRRAFIVFTTNAGAEYEPSEHIGFSSDEDAPGPRVDEDRMKEEIRMMGLGEEFLGRIHQFFIFRGLKAASVRIILKTQLEKLQDIAEVRGYQLDWEGSVISHLVAQWQPRFGVRHLIAILRNRIVEQLSIADAQGELKGIRNIRLELMGSPGDGETRDLTGMAVRERRKDTLVISLG